MWSLSDVGVQTPPSIFVSGSLPTSAHRTIRPEIMFGKAIGIDLGTTYS